jgi:hypothetical protein
VGRCPQREVWRDTEQIFLKEIRTITRPTQPIFYIKSYGKSRGFGRDRGGRDTIKIFVGKECMEKKGAESEY